MKLVVDANIVVSCLIRLDGHVGELFLNTSQEVALFGPERLVAEVSLHRAKVAKLASTSVDRIAQLEETLLSRISIVPNAMVATQRWEQAATLVQGIDEKDDHYIALALHLNCPLWTGDQKLVNGLRRKNFKLLITSEELRKKLGA